jgi:lysophospholipase L1-like esterase
MGYAAREGGTARLNWTAFNQSRAGKLFAVLIVAIAFVVAWPLLTRGQEATVARLPLPGGGTDDRCAIWFIGSSTVYRWDDLAADMAPWKTVKRGLDGATFPQLSERFANDSARVPPRAIVLYAGENDLAAGTPVDRVLSERSRFLAQKARMFPNVPVFLVSLKPSPARWHNRAEQLAYNADTLRLTEGSRDLSYVEIGPLLMNGNRPGDHYLADGIHLKPGSYRLWVPALKIALEQRLGPAECRS